MEKYEFDGNNGLWYELQGDYYLPCLKLPEEEQAYIGICDSGTFGISRNIIVYSMAIC